MKPNYRRETPSLMKMILKNNGWTLAQFSTHYGVSYNTAQRWSAGITSPGRNDFGKLKAMRHGANIDKMGEPKDDRLYQLTLQIQLLNEEMGRIKGRVEKLETPVKKKIPHAQPAGEPTGSR